MRRERVCYAATAQVYILHRRFSIIAGENRFDKEMISIEPTYPALDRAAVLIEHTCVPRYYPPTYCAEAAQLLAMLEAARRQRTPKEHSGH